MAFFCACFDWTFKVFVVFSQLYFVGFSFQWVFERKIKSRNNKKTLNKCSLLLFKLCASLPKVCFNQVSTKSGSFKAKKKAYSVQNEIGTVWLKTENSIKTKKLTRVRDRESIVPVETQAKLCYRNSSWIVNILCWCYIFINFLHAGCHLLHVDCLTKRKLYVYHFNGNYIFMSFCTMCFLLSFRPQTTHQ